MCVRNPTEDAPIVKAIRAYEEDIRHHRLTCRLGQCPKCLAEADGPAFFSRHEARPRTYLVIVERLVHTIVSLITRWKCPICRGTFTLYPPFALPRKRYVRQAVLERAQRYVELDRATYRNSVEENGLPICRDSGDERRINDRCLAHTTLYRWITTLGSLRGTLRAALDLIRQADPATGLFRDLMRLRIPSRKYRSEGRKAILTTCRGLGMAEPRYAALFDASIFPDYATASGWS